MDNSRWHCILYGRWNNYLSHIPYYAQTSVAISNESSTFFSYLHRVHSVDSISTRHSNKVDAKTHLRWNLKNWVLSTRKLTFLMVNFPTLQTEPLSFYWDEDDLGLICWPPEVTLHVVHLTIHIWDATHQNNLLLLCVITTTEV